MNMLRSIGLVLAIVVTACSSDATTTIKLAVTYEPSWELDSFEMTAGGILDRGPPSETVRVVVPDDWAGMPLMIDLDGLHAGEHVAHGTITVTPVLHGEVADTLVLTKLPCGAWCTPGATACMGDGVVVCSQRDEDSCMEWSEPTACDGGTPYCSLGVCGAACVDECVAGETRCAGPDGVQTCGQGDSDACADWLPAVACTGDDSCSNGACTPVCHDECEPGQTRCEGNGVSACGDLDANGCLEWSPMTTCAGGQTCSGGTCSATCTDECSASTCSGSSFTQCGQFDFDACMDLSPGTSCVPADPCREGECTASGCTDAPLVCDQPPAPMCVDANTLRTYTASGTCSLGTCSYAQTDTTCASGCSDGACNGSCGPCEVETVATEQSQITWLALDDTHVYWDAGDEVARHAKSGGTRESVASSASGISVSSLDGSYVYWIADTLIQRRAKSGGSVETIVNTTGDKYGLAVDATYVYFSENYEIDRVPLAGGTIEKLVDLQALGIVKGVDATYVYYTEGGALTRLATAGGSSEFLDTTVKGFFAESAYAYWTSGKVQRRASSSDTTEVIANESAGAVTTDATYIYWTPNPQLLAGTIRRRAKSGGSVEDVTPADVAISQVAVDATHVYWSSDPGLDGVYEIRRLSRCACGL